MSSKSNSAVMTDKLLSGTMSLKRRLLTFILIPLLLALLIAGTISFLAAKKETAEIYDKQLVLLAQVLLSLASQEDGDNDNHKITNYDSLVRRMKEDVFYYRIWVEDELVLTSENARGFKSSYRPSGFSDHTFDGKVLRVFVVNDEKNEIVVEVAGRENLRTEIIREILLFMYLPLAVVVPIIAILVWFGVVQGLIPISKISKLIKSRDPHNLSPLTDQEASLGNVPDDIKPLVDSLNSLMLRTKNVLEAEKNFADNAAHELQTPLAAIKAQAQVALRTKNEVEKNQLLQGLEAGVSRASHMVSQLLSLTRAQAEQQNLVPVRLDNVVNEVMNEFRHQYENRNQTIKADIKSDTQISGIEGLLFVLMRNLLDNASKYSPDGSEIKLSLHRDGADIVFTITNPGPGIPVDKQAQIFEPFYRLPGSKEIGCGLGLALANKICDIHGAHIHLDNQAGKNKICFAVTFPGFNASA